MKRRLLKRAPEPSPWVYVGRDDGPPLFPGFTTGPPDPLRYRDNKPLGEDSVWLQGEAIPDHELGKEPEIVFVLPEGLRPVMTRVAPVITVDPSDPMYVLIYQNIIQDDGAVLIALVGRELNPNWDRP